YDTDGDGVQDVGETGIGNVIVQLTPPAGVDLGAGPGNPITTTTDGSGNYLFDNLPLGGVYKVEVVASNFGPGKPLEAMTNTGDPDGVKDSKSEVTLTEDKPVDLDQDFGYRYTYPGKIGDTVWKDTDGDGVQDVGESGIGSVIVQLTPPAGVDLGAGAGNPITTTTDSNGNYLFDNLPLGGVYKVEVVASNFDAGKPLEGMINTGDPDGVMDSKSEVTLTEEKPVDLDQDFGYRYPGKIGDTIWKDTDGDGVQDVGETGIGNVIVQLTPPAGVDLGAGPGNPITTPTDSNGNYLFDDLPLGSVYKVEVLSSNFGSGKPLEGMANTGDPDGVMDSKSEVTLTEGKPVDLDQDFGYQPLSVCPIGVGTPEWTDILGAGMGNMKTHKVAVTVNIPNYNQVTSLYAQMVAKDWGKAKYVRFIMPGTNNYVQVNAVTSPSSHIYGTFWYGDYIDPAKLPVKSVTGRWFLQASGTKYHIPRAMVLYPTYAGTPGLDYFNIWKTYDAADTQVYWDTAAGWVQEQVVVEQIAPTQLTADITVKVALADNDKDKRPVWVTVEAGGVSQTQKPNNPNKGDQLNVMTFTLDNVPAGTSEIKITLYSPSKAQDRVEGDSVTMVGMTANYICQP
ncbi:MAG: hypothetical protein KBF17_13575, partial [Candidatus Promineofilum sp.]|nr:hypothetical protein [Promineifilum sp.]